MSHRQQIYDREKVQFNLVKYTKFGKSFELAVEPDLAIEFKSKNKGKDDLSDVLKSEKIFSDVKKGTLASSEEMKQVFGTDSFYDVALKMIMDGEIQLTSDYREKLRQEKKRKIIHLIHRAAIDPKTNTPHPEQRIENAMHEAKVKIDEFKKAEDQIGEIMHALKPIIPIKLDETTFNVKLPMKYASKLHSSLKNYGKMENEMWVGELFTCRLTIPAGMQEELLDELNSKTHGLADITLEKK